MCGSGVWHAGWEDGEVTWDGTDDRGRRVAPLPYYFLLKTAYGAVNGPVVLTR